MLFRLGDEEVSRRIISWRLEGGRVKRIGRDIFGGVELVVGSVVVFAFVFGLSHGVGVYVDKTREDAQAYTHSTLSLLRHALLSGLCPSAT
jgi:hypothetical protein